MYGRQDATRDRCLDASGLLSGKDATLSDDLGRTPLPAASPTDSVCLFMFQLFSPVRSPPRGEPGFFCASFGNQFAQELQSLWPKRGRKDIGARGIAAWPVQTFHKAVIHRIAYQTLRKKLPATVIHPSHGHCRAPGRLALGPRGRGHFWKNSLSVQPARFAHNRLVGRSSPSSPTTQSDANRRFPVSDE
jgi:hypothetical protein